MATAGARKRSSPGEGGGVVPEEPLSTKCAIDKKKLNELWEKTSQSTLFFGWLVLWAKVCSSQQNALRTTTTHLRGLI